MLKRQTRFSSAVTRSAVLAVAGIMFLTIAAGASSAAGFGVVDSVKELLGLTAGSSSNDRFVTSQSADHPEALLLTDDFDYPVGSLLTANGWTAHSGAGTNPLTVAAPGLSYPGYPGSGVGNAVPMTTSGEDAHRIFPAQTSGAVYAAVMLNVSEAVDDPAGIGGYVFHLGPDPISTTFRARFYVKKDATGLLAFGISKGAAATSADIAFTPFMFATNATHLVIVKYTIVDGATNDTVGFFVNPPLGGAEPTVTGTAPDIAASDINPGSVALRQGAAATAPTLVADGIRIGTAWADVAGGGGGTPNPTPTQSPGGGTPTPTPTPSPSPSASPSPVASPSPTVPPVPFTPGNVVLYRVGDGTAALTNAATTVFLDEYTTGGAFVQSIRMPVEVNGSHHILTATGTSSAEGMMTLSTDGNSLVLTGYDKAPGGTNPSVDPPATTNRVVGRVASNASVDTTTALNDPTTNIRSAASTNGVDLWLTASGNGSRYTTLGSTTSTQLATTPTNLRATAIFNGQLYVSSATGAFQGISTVGTGLPTTSGQTITLLNGFPTTAGPSPMQFAFFDANTLYVADDRTIASGGGIQKWTQSGGTWTLVNTLNNGLTAGVRGLVLTGNATARIFATTADNPSKLVTVLDDGTATPPFTILATTEANTAWRGLAFTPGGAVVNTQHFLDFNGDGRTDYAVTRNEGGLLQWYIANNGTPNFSAPQWGISTDNEVPADYDGDNTTDVAVFRDTEDPSRAHFYILRSSDGTVQIEQFGRSGDDAARVIGDWDGDGKDDVAVLRQGDDAPCGPGHLVFYWRPSGTPGTNFLYGCWGVETDAPYAGDFDGDGRMDMGVIRRPGGQNTIYIRRSSDGNFEGISWGNLGDTYFPCDYDGDGKNDICLVRVNGTNAEFYILTRTGGGTGASPIIFSNIDPNLDQLAFGDYDGDGRTDMGILHPSSGNTTFVVRKSSDGGVIFFPWGVTGDHSVAEVFAGGSGN